MPTEEEFKAAKEKVMEKMKVCSNCEINVEWIPGTGDYGDAICNKHYNEIFDICVKEAMEVIN